MNTNRRVSRIVLIVFAAALAAFMLVPFLAGR